MDIVIRNVEEKDGQYKIYNKDGTGGYWYITKESADPLPSPENAGSLKETSLYRQLQELFIAEAGTWMDQDTFIDTVTNFIEQNFVSKGDSLKPGLKRAVEICDDKIKNDMQEYYNRSAADKLVITGEKNIYFLLQQELE